MKTLINIYNFLKGLNKNVIIFILGALFMLLFLRQCNQNADLKRQLGDVKVEAERSHNNYLASQDSVIYYRTKAGSLIAEKRAFVLQLEEFENNYKDLKDEYTEALGLNKNLEKQNVLLKADIEILSHIKPTNSTTIISDTSAFLNFSKIDDFGRGNSRLFEGKAKVFYSNNKFGIDENQTYFNFKQTIKLYASIDEKEGYKKVKIASFYPGLDVEDIENINLINNKLNELPQKRSRWVAGIGGGYGISLINGSSISFSPWIGVSVLWTPKWLQFGK
jgi:hypothetical protein